MSEESAVNILRSALDRLRNNAQYIFDKKTVRDWAETLAEADLALASTAKVGQPKVGELPPLKHWRSSCETTLAGHTIIARENEAPYAYTCAGSAQEICDAVNNYRAEQQVSAGLRARLDGRFEQLALMSGRAIYAEQLLEKAEASLAEARVGTSHLYVPKAQYEAAKARSERLQKLLDAYNSSGFADADAAMEKYLDAINELATLKAQEAPEKAIAKAAWGVRKFGSDYRAGTHAEILWKLVDAYTPPTKEGQ